MGLKRDATSIEEVSKSEIPTNIEQIESELATNIEIESKSAFMTDIEVG